MQRHHTGSGRRRAIPDDWSAHHRPVVAGTWTATCEIRHPGGTEGDFNDETGTRPVVPHAPHYGVDATEPNARVQTTLGSDRESAGQQITVSDYLVVVNLAASAQTAIGDLVRVTAIDDNGDPWIVGRELTVSRMGSGSLAWERDLFCTDPLG